MVTRMSEKYARKTSYQIMVNQAGYNPERKKMAYLPFEAKSFQVKNMDGEVCFSGETLHFGQDTSSGDDVYVADFSNLAIPGNYVVCSGEKSSAPFEISEQVYNKVFFDLMKAFYFLRCGLELEEKYAGEYVHKACHTQKALVWDKREESIDATGGWHDAGDYGRYITAGSCAVAHLLYAYKMYPEVFDGLNLNIPESGNGMPDILNECKYELDWFLKMQREDGAVYHKLSTAHHAAFVMPEKDLGTLYAYPVSSMATADFSAICALASDIYKCFDEEYAKALKEASLKAYQWLQEHPEYLGFKNPEGTGTGEYGERDDYSNRYWAAAALYALTGKEEYMVDMQATMRNRFPLWCFGYAEVGGFGSLSYLLCQQKKDETVVNMLKDMLKQEVLRLKKCSDSCGYQVSMDWFDYCWGSNMNLMKNGMTYAVADCLLEKEEIAEGIDLKYQAQVQLDYLLGANALGISYVTGTGAFRCNYPHLRPAHDDGIEECIPGMVCGGPNAHPADATAKKMIPEGTPAMRCFVDHVYAYSLNEITIYWNSPAVFTMAYLLRMV